MTKNGKLSHWWLSTLTINWSSRRCSEAVSSLASGPWADSLPWLDSPLVQGASWLRYTDKAQMQRPGHTGRKALATKKLTVNWSIPTFLLPAVDPSGTLLTSRNMMQGMLFPLRCETSTSRCATSMAPFMKSFPFDPFYFCTKVHPTGALLFTPHHSQLILLQHLCIQFQLDDGWPESGEMKFWRRTYIKL